MEYLGRHEKQSGPMYVETRHYHHINKKGEELLLTESTSILDGRTLVSWSVKRSGLVCAIASFSTAESAISFTEGG